MTKKEFTTTVGGKQLTAEFTDLADQANGSVMLKLGNTTVLVTAVMGKKEKDIDYFPLTVDYEEKFYAAGKIPGSFPRREGRPSDDAILAGRVVDRTIRPLFNPAIRTDVQVVVTVLSIDEDDPDVLGVTGGSIALATSDIPWGGPVSAVRIEKKKGSDAFIVNPTYAERNAPDMELDLLVCGKDGVITMIEVGSQEVSEELLSKAFTFGVAEIEKIQKFQKDIVAAIGKTKKEIPDRTVKQEVIDTFNEFEAGFEAAIFAGVAGKAHIHEYMDAYVKKVTETMPEEAKAAIKYFDERLEKLMRDKAIGEKKRVDGRAMDELRSLYAQAGGVSPILHGSGIFYRGGTHIFSALALAGPDDAQIIDSIEGKEEKKRFMHHYNFPPFSVGETGRLGGMNRRMIGHGALAEKALSAVIPPKETFPYTIRLVSEALASNGSTSMGSVCASTLALMDGGVPITAPVAGIAMGVLYESESRYAILTDIQGPEDEHGDMDFKVAGTSKGVTAIQLDVKVEGVPVSVLSEGLLAAKKARLQILDVMAQAIATPRADLSPRAPKIVSLSVPVDMIGMVIGPSGKNIRKIEEETGVTSVAIEDDGTIFITGIGEAPERAAQIIRDMTRVFKAGDVIEGPVTRLMNFGAFVRLNGKNEGLVHVSEIAPFRIARVEDALQIGETVKAVVKEIDDQGRVNLSIKMIDPEFASRKGIQPSAENDSGGDGRGYNGRRDGDRRDRRDHRW
ncbi:polyribonucleotide nucleotidyltransferase [Candidatus Kaiserbacteria bacterium]|nr:polyribonucleotide nucleotidyltransferase [Candidatus Kaiserbacteria bacterium]